jgi:tetratricopeptide (TPR) repeat protein
MSVGRQLLLCLALLGLWLGAGCRGGDAQPVAAEIDEPYYRQGQQLVKQGRTQEALASFLKVIEKRGEQSSAESHLEAGLIYLQHSKDPVEAYHHFRQYLAQQPNARQAQHVRELVDTAKREFARTLPGQQLEQAPRLDLLDQLTSLKRENEELRAEMAALRNGANAPIQKTIRAPANAEAPRVRAIIPPPAATIPVEESPITLAPEPAPSPVTAARGAETRPSTVGPRTVAPPTRPGANAAPVRHHTVAAGDTLFGLTKKYYGTGSSAKADAIYEANRDVMKSKGDLRPGMEIKIP